MRLFLYHLTFFFILHLNGQQSDFNHIDFKKPDSIAHSFENASLNNLPILAYNLTHNLDTQVEKFRAIHTWVCSNIESDHSFSELTIRKRKKFKHDSISFIKWNNQVQPLLLKKLVNYKKTICSGYAYLLKELSNLVDIECEIVDGYSRTIYTNVNEVDIPNHSWNTVKLNNKWYLVDTTLASGYYFVNENRFIKNYNDGYFLAEPELFFKNHFPLDKKWLLLENKPTLNEFVKGHLIYSNTYKEQVIPISPKGLVTKIDINEDVVFTFKILDESKLDNINLEINSGLKYERINASSLDCINGLLKLKYSFTKKGQYDVHLKVDEVVIVSYTVEVQKHKNKQIASTLQ